MNSSLQKQNKDLSQELIILELFKVHKYILAALQQLRAKKKKTLFMLMTSCLHNIMLYLLVAKRLYIV